ncbi:MAG: DUF58 domain-containing protein [Nocardioidaceae bacterium]|nr:DUF58 domain-containing protein [Nocardioidaceae bacterium]
MREALSALTTRGRAFLAAGGATIVCSLLLGYDALMRVGILAAAVPLLTAAVASRSRYRLRADRLITPGRVGVGETATVTLRLANEGRMPTGLLLLEDRVPYALGTRPRFVVDHMGRHWSRDVSYPVRSDSRGHFTVGPLSIRVSDSFGMIELVRTFSLTSRLVVTPTVHALPALTTASAATGAGERRPRAFSIGSAEDVTVREYRRGDDLRRVHWRSTARTGELMVRREEQPWQSRATVLLDGRLIAHEGTGPGSSLEWAVSAAASVSVFLARSGYAIRLITDQPDSDASTWHDHTQSPQAQTAPVLDRLAAVRPSAQAQLAEAAQAITRQPGLLVAVLGRLRTNDVAELSRALPPGSRGLAMLLDADAWRGASAGRIAGHASMLRTAGWTVSIASPGDPVPMVWRRLGAQLHGRGGPPSWAGSTSAADVERQSAGGR